jgi:hypothetical protein
MSFSQYSTSIFVVWGLFAMDAFAQTGRIKDFYQLFEEVEFDRLEVYSDARRPEKYHDTNLYPFGGVEVDTNYYVLLRPIVDPIDSDVKYSSFYASRRFYITGRLEGLLVREYHDGGRVHHIHLLIFENQKQELLRSQKLSYAYAYEGSFGRQVSWVEDLNGDGRKDILTRLWSQNFVGSEADELYIDSMFLSISEEDSFRIIPVSDTAMRQAIAVEYPYERVSYGWLEAEGALEQLIKDRALDFIKPAEQENWVIIAGSDQTLEAATYEINRAKQIIGVDQKHGLDFRNFDIYENKKRYYTANDSFRSRAAAEIALVDIRIKLNKTAYILKKSDWCIEETYENGYIKCGDK